MSNPRFGRACTRSLALFVGLVFAVLTGCPPVPQQPNVPTDEEPNQTTQPPADSDSTIDRPIPPPVLDDDTTTVIGGGGGTTPPGGGGGGGGGGQGQQFIFLNVTAPGSNLRVRPGVMVDVKFEFQDSQGAAQKVELLIARDDNADNQPDGVPVRIIPISAQGGSNTFSLNTTTISDLLVNGYARFVFGVRVTTLNNTVYQDYSSGSVVIDDTAPTATWVGPLDDALTNRVSSWPITVTTTDNSPHTVRVLLDKDNVPLNGNEFELLAPASLAAGTNTTTFSPSLLPFPVGTYYYYVITSDGIDPADAFYAERSAGDPIKIRLTNRLIGSVDLGNLGNNLGGIFQGFNFNDLAGSSIRSVPDLNGDGRDELVVGSRFGKPRLIENNGVGFGEAYLIYGSAQRFTGTRTLNSVGTTTPGLVFFGMRTPRNASIAPQNQSTRWTSGLSDITVIPDMDGDNLPELVFSFPRVESINLGETNPTIQHPELSPDLPSMGNLEYNAFYGLFPVWHPNEAQLTRGGIVIVSSQNEMLQSPALLNRKSDRVIDLHEVGQLFTNMGRPSLIPYIRNARTRLDGAMQCADCDFLPPNGCDPGDADAEPPTPGNCGEDNCVLALGEELDGRETLLIRYEVFWDVVFNNQGPGGFHQPWTAVPANPPLASPLSFPFTPPPFGAPPFPFSFYPNRWAFDSMGNGGGACGDINGNGCEVTNHWFSWSPTLPGTTLAGTPAWATQGNPVQTLPTCYPTNPCITEVVPEDGPCPAPSAPCTNPALDVAAGGATAWTGFYGPTTSAFTSSAAGTFPSPTGARVLGQKVNDRFGTAIGSDGNWLYISAPERTANDAPYGSDVPSLPGTRSKAGIVYQLRTNAPLPPDGITRTQLWMERGTRQEQDPNFPDDPNAIITVGLSWPYVDAQLPNRVDYTMPVPHNYIIESVGSIRGNPEIGRADRIFGDPQQPQCPPGYDPATDSPDASAINSYTPYPAGTSGYFVDRTPQIVGPHANAKIEFVRALGDVNGDGIRDFAVGSAEVRSNVTQGTGDKVGAIFIVYGRPTGLEGDYLLEQLALNRSDPNRLAGILIKGVSTGETLARVFEDAGDFNGDGFADVVIGNEGANNNTGEVIVLFGSSVENAPSSPGPGDPDGVPGGGWTPDTIPLERAIRLVGANPGDLAGANVSSAGDVDNDGKDDLLIAAPGADGGRGAVYLIYGSNDLFGEINLGSLTITNTDVAFAKFVGRKVGDALGGGTKIVPNTDPGGGSTTAYSQGLSPLGDIDGDGNADFAISAMLADPGQKVDAGEIYILYGRTGP